MDDVEQSDWDELVYRTEDSNGDRENGFHIPNATDIINLRKIVGSNTVLQTLLTINNDGTCTPRTTQWGTSTGGFWQNPCDTIVWSKFPCGIDPNKKDGCGVMLLYFLNDEVHGDALWTCYPEVKDIRCNVRLMRSIKKTQW